MNLRTLVNLKRRIKRIFSLLFPLFNLSQISGDSYLDLAKENGDEKMIELLKKYGAKE